ncbi:hypothetical protein LTR05_007350 [Lithohypha guttulata]|uniref:Uncharacterized protein n=1 Tax=Lithohypha guttulata TaxID=1690604 RepID=A0AAN7SUY1_9EURO|nr:hypothetical protein LTR05_007350 [Lithohypha guttulata]
MAQQDDDSTINVTLTTESVSSKAAALKVHRSDLARFQEDSSSDNVTHTRRQERFIISDSESHDEVTAGHELFRELRSIEQIEWPGNLEGDENSDEEQAQIDRQLQAELNTYLEETVEDQGAGHYLRKKRLQSTQRSTRLASVERDSEHDEEQEHRVERKKHASMNGKPSRKPRDSRAQRRLRKDKQTFIQSS